MTPQAFDQVQQAYAAGGARAALKLLIETLRAEKNYAALFDALLMKRRHELGMPLLAPQNLSDLDKETRRKYEDAYVAICREVGELYLAAGDLPRAWLYFRTIGEPGKVRDALERAVEGENMDELIDLAYREGAHPRKGFEWILKCYGTCRAITSYEQFPPGTEGKTACAALLVRQLHRELVDNLKHQIAQKEGEAPATDSIPQLLQGREWLVADNYNVDVSHLVSVTRFSIESEDPEVLRLAFELADYGKHLPEAGYFAVERTVKDQLRDLSIFLRTLLGEDVEGGIAHFKQLVASAPEDAGSGPAQILVYLLARLGRFDEAIEVSFERLADLPVETLGFCPSIAQLCQMSKNHRRLMEFARQRGDLLTFTAGLLVDKLQT